MLLIEVGAVRRLNLIAHVIAEVDIMRRLTAIRCPSVATLSVAIIDAEVGHSYKSGHRSEPQRG